MIITIDGPVASGKSSVAQLLAQRLGFYHVNTGLLYRAVAYIAAAIKVDLSVSDEIGAVLPEIAKMSYIFQDGQSVIQYGKHDITRYLKLPEYDQAASLVSANAQVRQALLEVQRCMGREFNIIADGRDCGSVVYPDADYKFYLTAPLEVRALRMAKFFQEKTGHQQDLVAVQASIAERDRRDATRAVAPLVIPEGALVLDNEALTLEQTVDVMLQHIKK